MLPNINVGDAVRSRNLNDEPLVHRVSMTLDDPITGRSICPLGIGIHCEDDDPDYWWSEEALEVVDEAPTCIICLVGDTEREPS